MDSSVFAQEKYNPELMWERLDARQSGFELERFANAFVQAVEKVVQAKAKSVRLERAMGGDRPGIQEVMRSSEWLELQKQPAKPEELVQPEPQGEHGKTEDKAELAIARVNAGRVTATRVQIDNFIQKVNLAGRKINRTAIWKVAGYSASTEFERFQREDSRTTQSAAATFRRVLSMAPDEFIRALENRP